MKTEVSFVVSNPVPFTSIEDYTSLGIEISVHDDKLVAIRTIIEHDIGAGYEDIVMKATSVVTSLLTLIEFGYGLPVGIAQVQMLVVEPPSEVSIGMGFVKAQASLARNVPMPPRATVASLIEATRLQLNWYLLAQNSESVIECIKNCYKVLDQEEVSTRTSPNSYVPIPEAKFLRDAVSHPEPRDSALVTYLQTNLGARKIDPKNQAHIRFLETKLPILQQEAQRILYTKVPKWWQ